MDDRAKTKEMTMDQSGGDHLMIMARVYENIYSTRTTISATSHLQEAWPAPRKLMDGCIAVLFWPSLSSKGYT